MLMKNVFGMTWCSTTRHTNNFATYAICSFHLVHVSLLVPKNNGLEKCAKVPKTKWGEWNFLVFVHHRGGGGVEFSREAIIGGFFCLPFKRNRKGSVEPTRIFYCLKKQMESIGVLVVSLVEARASNPERSVRMWHLRQSPKLLSPW